MNRWHEKRPSAAWLLLASVLGCTNEEDLGNRAASDADGGSGPGNEWSSFFDQPAAVSPTPNSVYGLWDGYSLGSPSGGGGSMRIRFEPNSIVVAFRCESNPVTGGSFAAAVSSTTIKVLENYKEIGDAPCDPGTPGPEEYVACATGDTDLGPTASCFFLEGTSIHFAKSFFGAAKLTKVSD